MKNTFYTYSAFTLVFILGISFYFTLFNIFAISPFLGCSIVAAMLMVATVMVTDGEFIADLEE